MAFKVFGLGPIEYLRDKVNWLDGSVVLFSLVELIFLSKGGSAVTAFRAIRVFRVFRTLRVLRIAKLFKFISYMDRIISAISGSISNFAYIALLLVLFIIIFALLGMQLFGGKFDFAEGRPRQHFDNFYWSCVTVFQIMTMENWNEIMYCAMRGVHPLTAIYFVIWIFIGNFVLLNLFLAIMLDRFSQTPQQENLEMENENENDFQSLNKIDRSKKIYIQQLIKIQKQLENQESESDSGSDNEDEHSKNKHKKKKQKALFQNIQCQRSLLIFSKASSFRILCYKFSNSNAFENSILLVIFLSTMKLVIDTYFWESDNIQYEKTSEIIDLIFTVFFTVEMLIKIISLGFYADQGSYLRDGWNQMDCFIVFSSLLDQSLSSINLPVIKVLRILRTLRPLRVLSHNIAMKIVVTALIESLGAIFNVAIIVALVWLMFAILGINLYKGKFFYCTNQKYLYQDECEQHSYEWKKYNANFDSLPNAMITLFILASQEGWPDLMLISVDSTGVDKGPIKDNQPFQAIFYLLFILVGSYFFLNVFIAVLFDNFNQAKIKEETKNPFITKEQTKWIEMQKLVIKSYCKFEQIVLPKNKIKLLLHKFINWKGFEIFILICIVLNMIEMACVYDGATEEYSNILEKINLIFTFIFVFEACLKIIALGFLNYLRDAWNKFDFFVVITSLVDFLISYAFGGNSRSMLRIGPQLARTMRVFRVSRLFRLVKSFKGLQTLIQTLLFCVPSLLNVASLLLLVFFIYSILGVFLFHSVKNGEVIDDFTNFHNFGKAMITLLRACTGEEWNTMMFDCSGAFEGADLISKIFFTSFVTISNFVMLNMFIMVIINLFEEYHINPDNILNEWKDMEKEFQKHWSQFTADTQGIKLHSNSLIRFFKDLKEPLGFDKNMNEKEVLKNILGMEIKADEDGYIYYNQLLFYIMRKVVKPNQQEHKFKSKTIEKLESKTLGKIHKINKKISKQKAKKSKKDYVVSEINTQIIANPFISSMYIKKTFKYWKIFVQNKKQLRSEGNKKQYNLTDNSVQMNQASFLKNAQMRQATSELDLIAKIISRKVDFENNANEENEKKLMNQRTSISHLEKLLNSDRSAEENDQILKSNLRTKIQEQEKIKNAFDNSQFSSDKNSNRSIFQDTLISDERQQGMSENIQKSRPISQQKNLSKGLNEKK